MIGKYTIPNEIKEKMSYDFLKEFRNQLIDIFNLSLETYADSFYGIESTAGWANALKAACHSTGKDDIWNYWNELEWYDSDIFDGELVDILIENRLILPVMVDIFKNYLDIEPDNLRICDKCGGVFTEDMILDYVSWELPGYICKHCDRHKED